jgi:hypothetical protein
MYTIYQITPPHMTSTKIKDGEHLGKLRKEMNSLKSASKSSLYGIWDEKGRMYSSMMNK